MAEDDTSIISVRDTSTSSDAEETFVLHEVQDSALCGQHCLNNLIQQAVFNTWDLAEIAQELDQMERDCLGGDAAVQIQGNVDNSGNFSLAVLTAALKRSYDIELISWTSTEGREQLDVTRERGFIVNSDGHWYTIRKIGNHWWNLDSMLPKPVHISPLYLELLLTEKLANGSMVFLARGNVPVGGTLDYHATDNPNAIWHAESHLLQPVSKKSKANPSELSPFSAVLHAFRSEPQPLNVNAGPSSSGTGSSFEQPFVIGDMLDVHNLPLAHGLSHSLDDDYYDDEDNDDDDDDEMLRRAIAESLQDQRK